MIETLNKPKTMFEKIVDKLDEMEVGDTFIKKDFIMELYGEYDYFINQNFGNTMNKAKKKLNESLEIKRTFKSINGIMTRLT